MYISELDIKSTIALVWLKDTSVLEKTTQYRDLAKSIF